MFTLHVWTVPAPREGEALILSHWWVVLKWLWLAPLKPAVRTGCKVVNLLANTFNTALTALFAASWLS